MKKLYDLCEEFDEEEFKYKKDLIEFIKKILKNEKEDKDKDESI